MKRTLRGLLIAVPLLALVACGLFFFVLLPQFREARATLRTGGTAATAAIERRDLDDILPASGAVQPAATMNLSFEVSGTVREVQVRAGDAVRAGDVIAILDPTPFEHSLENARQALIIQQANYNTVTAPPTAREIAGARAAVAQAEAALATANSAFENQPNVITASCATLRSAEETLKAREQSYNDYVAAGYQFDVEFRPDPESAAGKAWQQALDQRDIAKANCESTRRVQSGDTNVRSAQAALEQAQAALESVLAGPTQEQRDTVTAQLAQAKLAVEQAERNLSKTTLKAPVSGVITTLNIAVGQVVGAGGQPAAIIADTSTLHLDALVDENGITQVQPNMEVRFTLQGLPADQIFLGVVEKKSSFGQNSQGVIVYSVQIRVNGRIPVYLGMTADVQIVLETRKGVLVVPTRAIRREGDTQFIVVERADGTPMDVPVETGLTVDDVTEVSGEGLREGQSVRVTTDRARGGLFGGQGGG